LPLAAVIGLSACVNVSYERDASIRIPSGATAAFAGGTSEGLDNLDPAVANDAVHRRVQSAIVNQLQARGFKLVDDPQTADFVLRYFVRVQRGPGQVAAATPRSGIPASGTGWGMGWSWGGGGGVTAVPPVVLADVLFVVDLVQRATGNTAWRGTWRGDPGLRAPTQQEIDDTVARIFSSAPVAD
jgi:hypothetical protein